MDDVTCEEAEKALSCYEPGQCIGTPRQRRISAMREALQWFVDYRKALPNKHSSHIFRDDECVKCGNTKTYINWQKMQDCPAKTPDIP